MKCDNIIAALVFLATLSATTAVAAPVVTNAKFVQRTGTQLVDVTYDLGGIGPPPTVGLQVSTDGGSTWTAPVNTVTGAVGAGMTYGTNKLMTWNAGVDWPLQSSSQVKVRVTAWDLLGPNNATYARIPGGTYQMGDNLDGQSDAPVTSVTLSEYWLQTTEMTKAQWDLVRTWGLTNGYTDLSVGGGKGTNHPVHTVNWYDVVKWCNAASEREGLVPCYYKDGNQTVVYRTDSANIDNTMVKWGANGYRLPTEAEWEVAARGGLTGQRFPWGDTIRNGPASSGGQANYWGLTSGYFYDLGPNSYNSAFNDGVAPYTSPVGSFSANGYGLYDMAGNVRELCWDCYGTYRGGTNPQGPIPDPLSPPIRVYRSSSCYDTAYEARCARRGTGFFGSNRTGFRLARGRP